LADSRRADRNYCPAVPPALMAALALIPGILILIGM
jgi:hypothetical protein